MSNYNSRNTKILATHEQAGGNKRMLLLHTCDSGRLEYVIGSYFTVVAKLPDGEVREDGSIHGVECAFQDEKEFELFWEKAIKDYSWDWGHYFGDVVDAVDYWKSEVLGYDDDHMPCAEARGKWYGRIELPPYDGDEDCAPIALGRALDMNIYFADTVAYTVRFTYRDSWDDPAVDYEISNEELDEWFAGNMRLVLVALEHDERLFPDMVYRD